MTKSVAFHSYKGGTSGTNGNRADVYDCAAVVKSVANADTAAIIDGTGIVSKAETRNKSTYVVVNHAGWMVVKVCTHCIPYHPIALIVYDTTILHGRADGILNCATIVYGAAITIIYGASIVIVNCALAFN